MSSVADARGFQIGSEPVRGQARDQPIAVEHVQHHRRIRVGRIERPAGDGIAIEPVEVALQRPGRHVAARRNKPRSAIDSTADLFEDRTGFDSWRTEHPALRLIAGIEFAEFRRVVEHRPAIAIDECFGWRAFRENDIVLIELDVEVTDGIDLRASDHGLSIHQMLGLHQHIVEEHGVQRGDIEIAQRQVAAERALLDQDGNDVAVPRGEGGGKSASTDPFDWLGGAVQRNDLVADSQMLDQDFPMIGADAGAGEVAGRGAFGDEAVAAAIGVVEEIAGETLGWIELEIDGAAAGQRRRERIAGNQIRTIDGLADEIDRLTDLHVVDDIRPRVGGIQRQNIAGGGTERDGAGAGQRVQRQGARVQQNPAGVDEGAGGGHHPRRLERAGVVQRDTGGEIIGGVHDPARTGIYRDLREVDELRPKAVQRAGAAAELERALGGRGQGVAAIDEDPGGRCNHPGRQIDEPVGKTGVEPNGGEG